MTTRRLPLLSPNRLVDTLSVEDVFSWCQYFFGWLSLFSSSTGGNPFSGWLGWLVRFPFIFVWAGKVLCCFIITITAKPSLKLKRVRTHSTEPQWYIRNNYSPKSRSIVVDICRAPKRRGKYLLLFTDTEVNNCFSIYQTSG